MTATCEVATQIEERIRRRTGGRVQRLCVQIDDEKVVIHGEAPTYYSMQLAVAVCRVVICRDVMCRQRRH